MRSTLNISAVVVMLAVACGPMAGPAAAGTSVGDLRCEYRVNPLGIDAASPRLGWVLRSDARDVMQTAYQVLVASEPGKLSEEAADLWNSGKIESEQSKLETAESKS